MKGRKINIVISLILAGLIVYFFTANKLFISNTPKLNPFFLATIKKEVGAFLTSIFKIGPDKSNLKLQERANNALKNFPSITPFPEKFFFTISKNIYATSSVKGKRQLIIKKGTRIKIITYTTTEGKIATKITPLLEND